jgi:hypothetical protein
MNETDCTDAVVRKPHADLAAFLAEIRARPTVAPRGKLIFGLDATASRQPTWDQAASLQAGMFREVGLRGSLDLQLVYYRGANECRASSWLTSASQLDHLMRKIVCIAGETQIAKILEHAKRETEADKVGALIFVGDATEENPDVLVAKARELGRLKTPAFMFQEGGDQTVQAIFRDIALSTGGAYGRFDAGGAKQLGEMLKAAALYAVGGTAALEGRKDAASVLLLGQMKR